MRAEIIKIGNSKGLRLPKALLEQCDMKNTVTLTVKNNSIIVTPCKDLREGWSERFKRMAVAKDDALCDEDFVVGAWDEEDWQW